MRSNERRILVAGAALAFLAVWAQAAPAQSSSKLNVETVNDYSYLVGDHSQDTHCNTEGDNLWTALLASGSPYVGGNHYKDGLVWDTDFYDPDLTGNPSDSDTYNFDSGGTAISYVCAHGTCDDVVHTTCSSDADCGANAYCPGMPPLDSGEVRLCIKESARRLFTSSASSSHANQVWYGLNPGFTPYKSFALGEDAASGGYNGAGTNGGTNLAVIVNSCGIRSHYYIDDTTHFFGGTHSVMMAMPTAAWKTGGGQYCASDTATYAARGSYMANQALANPFAAVGDAWLNPTQVDHGFATTASGCSHSWGANIIIARDTTSSGAVWHRQTEGWMGARFESNDPKGNGYWAARWMCNYDCNTYGF